MAASGSDLADGTRVVFIDGEFVSENNARISIFDHAVLYGDGVFDTVCAWNGFLFRLDAHVQRLLRSAAATKMNIHYTYDQIFQAVRETVRRNNLRNAYVKIIVTRGQGPSPLLDPTPCCSSLIIFARPYLWLVDHSKIETGIRTRVASTRRIPPQCLDPKIKSLNYQNNAMAKMEALEAGCDEAIMLDLGGYVSEGPTYNIFIVSGDSLYTPQENILLGITRQTVLEMATRCGYRAQPAWLTPYDLYTADEAFFCSTAGGIIPIKEIDGREVGTSVPGPITQRLLSLYFSMLESGEGGIPIVD